MIRVDAFAKLTLSLHVLGLRADGYHDIDALTVSLTEPHDELGLVDAETASLAVTGPFASGVPTDERNLVMQALRLVKRPMAVTLHKGIPHGAGLGGGSADAAAVLVALVDDEERRLVLAAELGSDVPFCVSGGAARMRGRGERLERTAVPPFLVVVAMPAFSCSTPAVYRAWDDLGGPTGRTIECDDELGLPPLRNDLEPAAEHVEPRLATFRADVERVAGRAAVLAGSGSAYAIPVAHTVDAEQVRAAIAPLAAACVVGTTTSAGVVINS